jgi:trk system potassium uptake protein TrkH
MNWKALAKIESGLLAILGLILLIPGAHASLSGTNVAGSFFLTSFIAFFTGTSLFFVLKVDFDDLKHRMGFVIVAASWALACVVGALPYYFSGTIASFVDCFFESCSGFSGTGASVITNIDATDKSILLWRSLTQWLGGMGIIVFFVAILPLLGVGGQQLFQAETTGPSKDKLTPRVRDTAKNLWTLYFGYTLLLTSILYFLGMSFFDAVNHAMTTLSTGGFSTKAAGVAHFNSRSIDYAIALFMLIGSINFALHFKLFLKRDFKIFRETQLKTYLILIFFAVFSIMLINYSDNISLEKSFRETLFTVLATVSSTGYTYYDYLSWPVATHYIIILLMVMGGMSGSTAGGAKCIRLIAAFKLLIKELKQVVHPKAVLTVKINDKSVRDKVANAIWGFLFLYLFVLSIISLVLVINGVDLVSASTAAISALSNIGPALGELGPMDNYSALTNSSKIVLCFGMLLGRLEFFTILVLLTKDYWKN